MRKMFYTVFILILCLPWKTFAVTVLDKKIQPHPRLLFSSEEEKKIKRLVKKDPLAEQLYTKLLRDADSLLQVPMKSYKIADGYVPNMLQDSRDQLYRMLNLSLAWRMTRNEAYLKKAEAELLNVCNFPDWNPRHYLDVAEMTTAVAVAYDWLYDGLSKEARTLAVEAIKSKALNHVVREYEKGGPGSWAKRTTNWNVVCNTGMVIGAMAIADLEPELAGHIVENAVRYLPNCLHHFAPDGVWYEGPAYWGYTNNYFTMLLRVLNDNFNHDFGLSELPGINKTALYSVHTTAPSGKTFNFGNTGSSDPDMVPAYFFFSHRYKQPEVADFYRKQLSVRMNEPKLPQTFPLALAWFDATPWQDKDGLSKLNVYKSINDVGVLRGKDIYLIAKGGDPDNAHQQMDVGTFIVETDGIRWSDDLGSDCYDLPGFWDGKPNGSRWKYFRNNNFSHNTLSIDNKLQYAGGVGKITAFSENAGQPWFTVDMTSLYKDQADSVCRTFRLIDERSVEVSDYIHLNSETQTVTWNMITSAEISCEGRVARLSKDGKQFLLKINTPSDAVFRVAETPMQTEKEYPIKGYRLLQILTQGNKEVNINIVLNFDHK